MCHANFIKVIRLLLHAKLSLK